MHANTTIIDTIANVSLASGNSISIVFTLNTTGLARGNYTISAYVIPIPDETDIEDNTFIDATILVTIAGDVNGDASVDIFDLSIVGQAYGCFRWMPCYNPYADITGDGLVDAKDLAIVTIHYGETEP